MARSFATAGPAWRGWIAGAWSSVRARGGGSLLHARRLARAKATCCLAHTRCLASIDSWYKALHFFPSVARHKKSLFRQKTHEDALIITQMFKKVQVETSARILQKAQKRGRRQADALYISSSAIAKPMHIEAHWARARERPIRANVHNVTLFLLHLHHHWQNHGTPMRSFIQEFAQRMANLILHESPIGGMTVETDKRGKHAFARMCQ